MEQEMHDDIRRRYPAKLLSINYLPPKLYPLPMKRQLLNHELNENNASLQKQRSISLMDKFLLTERQFPFTAVRRKKPGIMMNTAYLRRRQDQNQQEEEESRELYETLMRGQRFNIDLNQMKLDHIETPLMTPIMYEGNSVRVGRHSIRQSIALPMFLTPTPTQRRSQCERKVVDSPKGSIRKASHADSVLERVRLKQVDILRKCNARSFSKEIQGKLKDDLYQILKQFE